MKTTLWLLLGLLLASGGALLGWVALPALFPAACQHPVLPAAPPSLVAAQHHFDLAADDIKLDKEKPALAVTPSGRALLAWTSQTGADEYTLFLAHSDDMGSTFSTPAAFRKVPIHRHVMISKGKERTMLTPLLPRLAVQGDTVTLAWLEPETGGTNVRFLAARSEDGGLTFGEPFRIPSADTARPNYTALTPAADGGTVALWLDSRSGTQRPFCAVADRNGRFAPETRVYEGVEGKGVCPCCDVDAVRAEDGTTVAAFRNAKDGCRDVYVARSGAELHFEAAVPVSPDSWLFDGCPHDAPALALGNGKLHVAWMDGHTGTRQVYLATSTLDKLAFVPRRLGPTVAEEQGHPRLAAGRGVLHAAWDQALPGSGRAVVYTCSHDDGETFAGPRMLAARDGVFQTHPVLAVAAEGSVLCAWNEVSEAGKRVVVARLAPAASAASCCHAASAGGCCDAPSRGTAGHER